MKWPTQQNGLIAFRNYLINIINNFELRKINKNLKQKITKNLKMTNNSKSYLYKQTTPGYSLKWKPTITTN